MRILLVWLIFVVTIHSALSQDGAEEDENIVSTDEAQGSEKLTVDQTLTIRILKTTQSKKTVLINRGSSDGLDMGVHARFFHEGGTVGRGVLVDLKDDRSIWSIYRQVSPDLLERDQVMTMKITPEVKITHDETKSVLREGLDQNLIPDRALPQAIPLDQVEGDLPVDLVASGIAESDMKAYQAKNLDISKKTWELFLRGFLLAQQAEATSSAGSVFKGSNYAGSVALGIESYFAKDSFLNRFSFSPFAHFGSQKLLSYEGAQTDTQFYEVGIGMNFYIVDSPHTAETLHPYFHVEGTLGVVNDEFSSGQRDSNRDAATISKAGGKTSSAAVGLGLKYFTPRGFAFTFAADMARRVDLFDADPDTNNALWDRIGTGARLSLGMGVRF